MNTHWQPEAERGSVVTITIMSILLLITIVGLNMSGTSEFQLLVARNETARTEAAETSQSAIDYTMTTTANFIPSQISCTANVGCANPVITLPTPPFSVSLTRVTVTSFPATTLPVASGSSADMYEAAPFNIFSEYDGTSVGEGGKVSINQGVLIIVPAGH